MFCNSRALFVKYNSCNSCYIIRDLFPFILVRVIRSLLIPDRIIRPLLVPVWIIAWKPGSKRHSVPGHRLFGRNGIEPCFYFSICYCSPGTTECGINGDYGFSADYTPAIIVDETG